MITICEDRYGRGWVSWRADPEDAPDGFNCGDTEHWEFYEAAHDYPLGWGRTPDEALAALNRETEKYQANPKTYRCRLSDQERASR